MRSFPLTKQGKLIALVAYLLILAVAFFAYRSNRATKTKRLQAELAAITSERNKSRSVEMELGHLTKLIPAAAGTSAYIESLYRHAKETGLKQHEAVTEVTGPASARPGAASTGPVAKHRIRIIATGSFRSFAEYIRLIQNAERFNRITEFKLTPAEGMLKGTIGLELYALPVSHVK